MEKNPENRPKENCLRMIFRKSEQFLEEHESQNIGGAAAPPAPPATPPLNVCKIANSTRQMRRGDNLNKVHVFLAPRNYA